MERLAKVLATSEGIKAIDSIIEGLNLENDKNEIERLEYCQSVLDEKGYLLKQDEPE